MNHQFDELTKGMAQSVTRRVALKKFGLGLAGMALACFGLTHKAEAQQSAQCIGKARFCGSGLSMPASCLTRCCSHDAYRRGGFMTYAWICK